LDRERLAAVEALGPALVGQPLDAAAWTLTGRRSGYVFRHRDTPTAAMVAALFSALQPQRIRRDRVWLKSERGDVDGTIVPVERPDVDLVWFVRKAFYAALRAEIDDEDALRSEYAAGDIPLSWCTPRTTMKRDDAFVRAVERLLFDKRGSPRHGLVGMAEFLPDALDPWRSPLSSDAETRAEVKDARAIRSVARILSPAAAEALRLALAGRDARTIAATLDVDARTVRRYMRAARSQLSARDVDLDAVRRRRPGWRPDDHFAGLRCLLRPFTPDEWSDLALGYPESTCRRRAPSTFRGRLPPPYAQTSRPATPAPLARAA
jgi:DNA-binding CsgD family transcriptional regulator